MLGVETGSAACKTNATALSLQPLHNGSGCTGVLAWPSWVGVLEYYIVIKVLALHLADLGSLHNTPQDSPSTARSEP